MTFILLCHANNSTVASLLKCVYPLSTSLYPSLLLFFMHHLILNLPILPSISSCLFIGICYSTWSYYHFKERQWAPALLLEITCILSQSRPGCFRYATGKDTLHWQSGQAGAHRYVMVPGLISMTSRDSSPFIQYKKSMACSYVFLH